MSIDKKYSDEVEHGGTFDPFKIMRIVLNKECSNVDYSHLAIAEKEAEAHLEYMRLFINEFGKSRDFVTGIMQERTELCNKYLAFLKLYKNGIDNRNVT